MRLLTHNMMASNVKGVKTGFPLKIEAQEVETKETEFNPDFIKKMYHKLEWGALVQAARTLGDTSLPDEVTEDLLDDEAFLKVLHHALMEIHVEEGTLICPETGRKFPIKNGIPNMLLMEDEC